jgi:hypothetical protein
MQEYISESIEPPTNPQFLNSSGHDKWSLHNLRNIRKGKFCNIFRRKYLEIHVHVPSKHPQQHSCLLPKSNPSQDESLFNSEHFITHIRRMVQKLQIFEQKSAFFPPCVICLDSLSINDFVVTNCPGSKSILKKKTLTCLQCQCSQMEAKKEKHYEILRFLTASFSVSNIILISKNFDHIVP